MSMHPPDYAKTSLGADGYTIHQQHLDLSALIHRSCLISKDDTIMVIQHIWVPAAMQGNR